MGLTDFRPYRGSCLGLFSFCESSLSDPPSQEEQINNVRAVLGNTMARNIFLLVTLLAAVGAVFADEERSTTATERGDAVEAVAREEPVEDVGTAEDEIELTAEELAEENERLFLGNCRGLSARCLKGNQCCSGRCLGRRCVPDCLPLNRPCQVNAECCSTACVDNVCVSDLDRVCPTACQNEIDQIENTLRLTCNDIAAPWVGCGIGTLCTIGNSNCATGECRISAVDGVARCTLPCSGEGTACFQNSDCCAGECDSPAFPNAGTCIPTPVTPPFICLPRGNECTDNSECCSTYCVPSTTSELSFCEDTPELFCRADGAACDGPGTDPNFGTGAQCCSGSRTCNTVQPLETCFCTAKLCSDVGEGCSDPWDCCSTNCDEATNLCVDEFTGCPEACQTQITENTDTFALPCSDPASPWGLCQIGESCILSTDCTTGNCINFGGVSQCKLPCVLIGQDCFQSSDCCLGQCIGQVCIAIWYHKTDGD